MSDPIKNNADIPNLMNQIDGLGEILPEEGNKEIPKELANAKEGVKPPVEKKDAAPEEKVELKNQVNKVIVNDLTGKAKVAYESAIEALKANVDISDIKENIDYALYNDKTISKEEHDKIVGLLDIANTERTEVASGKMPVIKNITDLTDFVRLQLTNDVTKGETVKLDKEKDSTGKEHQIFGYKGILFRGDNRPDSEIKSAGGFKSQKPLTDSKNKIESMALESKDGVLSGKCGVSTAKTLSASLGYLTDTKGRIYIIDSTKLAENEKAYDIAEIGLKNKIFNKTDGTEDVNVSDIQYKAVIGWFELTKEMIKAENPDIKNTLILSALESGKLNLKLNSEYAN